MLTAYDSLFAEIIDDAGIDLILVGDSVGNVYCGHDTTLKVTLDDMLHHTAAVSRVVKRALVVADMPFMSYQVSIEQAITNAGRLVQESGANAVKMEVGLDDFDKVRAVINAGIPVIAHLGLTVQKSCQVNGFKLQGQTKDDASLLIDFAKRYAEIGSFMILLEHTNTAVAEQIVSNLNVPVIGIGAGSKCDGQVLVTHDLLGMTKKSPSFAKRYSNLREQMTRSIDTFKTEVETKSFSVNSMVK